MHFRWRCWLFSARVFFFFPSLLPSLFLNSLLLLPRCRGCRRPTTRGNFDVAVLGFHQHTSFHRPNGKSVWKRQRRECNDGKKDSEWNRVYSALRVLHASEFRSPGSPTDSRRILSPPHFFSLSLVPPSLLVSVTHSYITLYIAHCPSAFLETYISPEIQLRIDAKLRVPQ